MMIAWKTVEKLNPEVKERRPETKPRQRLMIAVGGGMSGGALAARRVLVNLEEEEARAALGVDLEDFPTSPVKVKMSLEILED